MAEKRTKKPRAPTTRRVESKLATREALIDAGMKLFAKRGLDGPSLDDICAKANLTRGAFYVHFEDRDDFLVAVMDRVGASILDELLATGSGGFGEVVARFVAASASGRYPLMPKGGIRPYQLLDACARSAELRERYVGILRMSVSRVAAIVGDGQSIGALRSDLDATNVATLIAALVAGLQTLADLGMPLDLEALAPDVVRFLGPTT